MAKRMAHPFGKKLKRYIELAGATRESTGASIGVTSRTIALYINGHSYPSARRLPYLVRYLAERAVLDPVDVVADLLSLK